MSVSDFEPGDRAIKTFMIGADETLVIGTEKVRGPGGTDILRLSRPGEYALIPTAEILSGDRIARDTVPFDDLDVSDLKVVGQTVGVAPGEEVPVSLRVGSEVAETYSYPGIYGLLHVPFGEG